ncbi:MAG: ATP-dependent DNA helicase RecG [Treponema sp.]|nr:ATP-dependent DNA helicase RecG [Treponema sp.]
MKVKDIRTPVSSISGIGPQLTKLLAKLNVFTVGDLLQFFPRDYEDRTKKVTINQFKTNHKIHTVAMVMGQDWFGYGKMKNLKVFINDGTASAELICFNRQFLQNVLTPGSIVSVTGDFFEKYGTIQSSSFEVNKLSGKALPSDVKQMTITPKDLIPLSPPDSSILPVYPLTEGLTQKVITKAIATAISQYAHGIEDEVPDEIIQTRQLLHKQDAIKYIHQPENLQQIWDAKKTLIYEELYHFQYTMAERAYKHRGELPSSNVQNISGELKNKITDKDFEDSLSPLQKQLLSKLTFKLTEDQKSVIYEMNREIDKGFEERNSTLLGNKIEHPPFTMARLLQGDVGSGKTLTALFVCLRVINYKGQCAFMAPTEILARQHAETTAKMLDSLGVRTAFLTGNVKASGRTQLLKALKEGEIDIIIGTHALFSNQVIYKDLQLAVIDEQHRFGVIQRQSILEKGRQTEANGLSFEPHLLMMSATPIPQTLALTVFGDLDVSIIKTMPEGRKPIQTFLIKEGNEKNAYEAVRKELAKGHQAYFVYPAIEAMDSDGDNAKVHSLKSAEKSFENLSKNIYPEFKCALVHGKLEENEQIRILNDFNQGKIQVLAATTVVEVGVDVANATCMVIEQADHFGMAQLHQLRGRVGRGNEQSYCILIYSKNLSESGIERMKALRESTDGFYIAEQDLKTRGPGEMTGTLQAGNLELGIADVARDKDLLVLARFDALENLKKLMQHKTQGV